MRKIGTVMALAAAMLFVVASPAWASTGLPGPTPPKLGDPVGGNQSPHGGYSALTDFCLQCHSVHNSTAGAGEYALLWKSTVTATCNTCHALPALIGPATGPRDSNAITGFTTGIMGTASSRTAYDITSGLAASHPLGSPDTGGTGDDVTMQESGWSYRGSPAVWAGNAQAADGLQCTSCHTPHGDFGALVNSERGVVRTTAGGASLGTAQTWTEGRAIYPSGGTTVKYLHLDTDITTGTPDTAQWTACTATSPAAVADALDTGCSYLQMTDSEGQLVSQYGYKMLSAYPNFNWDGGGESWGLDYRNHDQPGWCGSCHPNKVASEYGGTYHNHPTGCSACHGNPTGDPTSTDFPHTSTFGKFLKSYPDGLCITCHTAGSLP